MEEQIKKRLQDIADAINRIEIHLKHISNYSSYTSDITVKSAVERELSIIGEAINQVKKRNPDIKFTGMDKIIAFRNFIIHAYDSVNDDIVWIILQKHLPTLKSEVEQMLRT